VGGGGTSILRRESSVSLFTFHETNFGQVQEVIKNIYDSSGATRLSYRKSNGRTVTMTEKILTTYPPPITTYLHHAYCLSLINLDTESKFYPWFIHNYILISSPKDLSTNRDSHTEFIVHYGDLMEIHTITWDIINKWSGGVIEFLQHCINTNNYIQLVVNERYIPGSEAYLKEDYDHNILVYGYNSEKETFNIKHMKNRFFSESLVTYEQIATAFENLAGTFVWSQTNTIYQLNDCGINFDLKRTIQSLKDYHESTWFENNSDEIIGIEVYSEVVNYFINLLHGQTSSDIRILHFLWEHKKCMRARVRYLLDNGFLQSENLYSNILELEKKLLVLRNLQLKYEITQDKGIIERIIAEITIIKQKEVEVFKLVLEELNIHHDEK